VPDPEQTASGADQQTGTAAGAVTQDAQTGELGDAAPQFDPAALSRAQSHGFSQDDIDSLGPANLSMVMRAADRMAASSALQQQSQVGADQQQAFGQIDPMQFAAALNLNKDDVDENVINAVNALNGHYANQTMKLMAAIGELVNRYDGVNKTVGRMTFDNHVNALGEDWHSVLGPPNARNAKELEKLEKQVALMQQLGTGNYAEAFQQALGSLHFGRLREMERKSHDSRLKRALQGTSERSRSREEEPAQSGLEKAAQRVRNAQVAEMGPG
jgi:hypothetical protein